MIFWYQWCQKARSCIGWQFCHWATFLGSSFFVKSLLLILYEDLSSLSLISPGPYRDNDPLTLSPPPPFQKAWMVLYGWTEEISTTHHLPLVFVYIESCLHTGVVMVLAIASVDHLPLFKHWTMCTHSQLSYVWTLLCIFKSNCEGNFAY